MHRRKVLATLGVIIPTSGCLSNATQESQETTSDMGIEITAPTVSPGGTVTITLDVQSTNQLRFIELPSIDATVEYDNAEFSPSPNRVWTREPPTWEWSSPQPVTATVPITVSDTVSPNEYQYSIAIRPSENAEEIVETFTLSVRE